MAAPTTSRPLRTLAVLLLIILGLGGLMLWQTDSKPKLALDLSGGTSVTLKAVTENNQAPKSDQMAKAVDIIRQRVNGLGVSEAEVTRQGDRYIVVAVPGQGQQDVVNLVGTTAELRFRQVLLETPATQPAPQAPAPTPSARPSATATPSPAASPSAHRGRSLAHPLAPPPSPSAPTTTSPTSPAAPTSPLGDTSGIDPAVLAQFLKLDCSKPNWKAGVVDDPNQQMVSCDQDHRTKYILDKAAVLGTDVKGATAQYDAQTLQGWKVVLNFKGDGTRKFGDITKRVYQLPDPRNRVAIVLDGEVISAPTIQGPIYGSAEITGQFTQKQAEDLANVLRYGALPLKFDKSEIDSVSATLGSDQLRGGLLAGAIGLGLVVLYSLLYYRGLSLVSVLSLAIAGALTYESVVLLGKYMGFRLSLAGIAGLIVAIGITADSFIVYFERLRDEVREGRSLRSAVETGWQRARRTVLVADAVSFLAALVLWLLAVGGVKGFAFTLGLTTLIDVLIVFLFTKPMVTYLARTRFFGGGHPWSGLDPRRLGGRVPALRRTRTPREA